jgi:hypothetical protein
MRKIKFTLCCAGILLLNQAARGQITDPVAVFPVGSQYSTVFNAAAANCPGFALTVTDLAPGTATLITR